MAEALLSAFLGVLFDRLASRELLNFARQEGLEKKLKKWSKMLPRIEAVLDDAEEKQENGVAVKRWLDDLRDLAYDADDILDEFATEALRQKLTGGNHAGTSKVWNFIPACCTGFTPSHAIKINMRLGSEMEEITARFNEMVKQKDDLKLSENVDRRRSNRTRQILAPTSVVTEAHLVWGGIGKTTLSQLVYNDEKVKTFFDVEAWACVSEDFDAVRVTKTILQSFTSENCEGKDLDWLQTKLKENLKGKKFFVVLDDLWNENYHDWSILRAPFEAGAPRSTIIITTRNKGVSSNTGTIPAPFSLKELSNDVCLSILAHHALGTRDFRAHLNLKDIGEEIVKRCKGSPLEAKVLGGVLRSKMDHDEWEDVLKNKIWDLPQVESEIAPALMLSYHHLPSHLKRCFAYCSVLPKDYLFKKKHLVLLWMAEGLLQPQEGKKQMEDLGSEYFHNLLSRSFFQQSFKDESQYLMHDLINDLAQRVAGDICCKMEDRVWNNNGRKPSTKARYSSYLGGIYDVIQKFEVFNDLTCLRTFLPLMLPYPGDCNLTSNVPLKLIPKLRRLRALSLSGYQICELPESIGDLKHLRFLNLSRTKIRNLPDSVATLYNLQTMILENCFRLKKLPSTFGNLVNLRHLNIRGANALEGMPPQMGKLTCLQSLSNIVVGKGSCFGVIKELGPLLHLRETLCISRLENVINHEDARDAKLFEKHNLYGLSLEWSCNLDESQDRISEFEVLNKLQPHKGLKELTVRHYGCAEFPTWLKVPSFSNMVRLEIESFAKCTLLPSVGQLPSLKHLLIKGMASVTNIGRDFCGDGCLQPFRSLETLHFENMQEWENWIPCEEIPKLRKLSIERCPKLVGKLPNLPLLENIVINECKQLAISISSFPENCNLEIEGSKGVINSGKVEFGSLRFKSLSTVSEFTCRIEGLMIKDLTNVEDLTIETCEELAPLWSNDVGLLQNLPCLRLLKISDCSKLISLVAKEVEEQLQLSLPSKLREIEIRNCEVLKSLPKPMMHVEGIRIWGCTSLTYFAISQLPPTLKRLFIGHCNMLNLVDGDDANSCRSNTPLLESLHITYCASLISLMSTEELPPTLKELRIEECEKLESIAKSFHHNSSLEVIYISDCENLKSLPVGIHSLSHLDKIFIYHCQTLVSFLDNGLFPANLRLLVILNCEKMQVLPNCILNLTSLQDLRIGKCPSISVSVSEVGFPTNLTSLEIGDMVSSNEAFFEWGLYKLTSLKSLIISGGSSHLVSFPEIMLPASLTGLCIGDFPNLKCLSSKGFQDLASLEYLFISNCEKLTSFPKDGFSPSLLYLLIKNCPLLKERCKKDRGPEWFKIAHIPCVEIDDRHINEPEEENQ
ncbi:putative disease resistance RPP13-like protein 1 [Alnus glutinosa]|uniref:putative disease resistance RPP13-like protein 1 n=1 Tax=Alnus glutinosa TaxID=3517 RepID=UPI002D77EDA0|nr:putative disease resistance RPP13-like protein 1 [Alnus glutinosa]